jgi:hypothetical protein
MNLAKRVTSKTFVNEVATLSQAHVNENQAVYQGQVQQFVDRTYPIVTKAFSTQATKDLPKFTEAFNLQRDEFVNNLRQRMDAKLAKKYDDLLKQHENLIVEEFPELKDKDTRDRVLANFQFVIEKLVKRNYGDQFNDEANKLIAVWESFPAAEEPGPADAKLEEKLLEHLLHVATGVMTTMQQQNVVTELPPSIPAQPVVTTEATPAPAETPAAPPAETPNPADANAPADSGKAEDAPQPDAPKEPETPKDGDGSGGNTPPVEPPKS